MSIEATTLTEWADLRDAIAHADRLTPGEVMAADTHPLAPVAAAARAFIAACTTPPTQPDGDWRIEFNPGPDGDAEIRWRGHHAGFVPHDVGAALAAALTAVPPTRPGADAVIRALIAACPSYGRGEGDTFHIEESAVVRLAREFLAAAPPTPTPCPYIVTGGEGTSHCSLAERSAMHAAAPPSTPAEQPQPDGEGASNG